MSVHHGCARIALQVSGAKIRAERAKLGGIKGQLEALIASLERQFTAAPFGETSIAPTNIRVCAARIRS